MLPKQLRHGSAGKGAPPPSHSRAASFAGSVATRKSIANTGKQARARAPSAAAHSVRTAPSPSLGGGTWLDHQVSDGRWSTTGRPSLEDAPEGLCADMGSAEDSNGGGSPLLTYSADVFEQLAAEAERRKVRLVDLFREVLPRLAGAVFLTSWCQAAWCLLLVLAP
jgi:hypothetical protein